MTKAQVTIDEAASHREGKASLLLGGSLHRNTKNKTQELHLLWQ